MPSSLFKWDEAFNTGNQIIDAQHYVLVEMINKLLEISLDSRLITSNNIDDISKQLSDYVIEHFETEETLMEVCSIDHRHVEDHIQSHKEFIEEIRARFKNPAQLLNPLKLNDIAEYLIRWLVYHILITDKNLIRQVNLINLEGISPALAFEKEEKTPDTATESFLKALKVLYELVYTKNREIERKNFELEKKVKQRTTELMEANKKLNQLILLDVLTGLPNKRFVMDEIKKMIHHWKRYKQVFSILFIDVDKFKSVNDNHGHEQGDIVLKWIATFLKDSIRITDIACRLGGDEFIIICSNTDESGALTLGDKLNTLRREKYEGSIEVWQPSLSIGIATMNDAINSPSEILNSADTAMYISKTQGGGIATLINA